MTRNEFAYKAHKNAKEKKGGQECLSNEHQQKGMKQILSNSTKVGKDCKETEYSK